MESTGYWVGAAAALALVGGFVYGSAEDLEAREVSDGLWRVLGVLGVALGVAVVAPGGTLPVALWLVAGALALEHLFPWEDEFGERHAGLVSAVELGGYAAVLAVVGFSLYRWGLGSTAVPLIVVAAVATVVLARLLFETGVLYGAADAKALIVVGVLVPVFTSPLLFSPGSTAVALRFLPFSLTVLTNAALLSLVVPIAIAVRNVARGEFSFPRGFTSYTLPVAELPRRFVWVRDPAVGEDTFADDTETSEDDTRRREEIARDLHDRGVERVWVSPQLPFLVILGAGAFLGLLAGNLMLDLIAVL